MTTVTADRDAGAFAVGAEFTPALPTTGEATYSGGGVVIIRDDPSPELYRADSEFIATFTADGAHTLSGTLTEDADKFILNFGESVFRNGEFTDSKVSCGGGACDDSGIADNFYNAKFFGTAGAGGNPTKLGGTFKATGLSLDGKDSANVVGAFGAELQ